MPTGYPAWWPFLFLVVLIAMGVVVTTLGERLAATTLDRPPALQRGTRRSRRNLGQHYACLVCHMPAPATPYAVRYEAGDQPRLRSAQIYLCDPHAAALKTSEVRPVLPL